MKLKLIYDPRGGYTRLVNAATGELVENVFRINIDMPVQSPSVTKVELRAVDVEMYDENLKQATVEDFASFQPGEGGPTNPLIAVVGMSAASKKTLMDKSMLIGNSVHEAVVTERDSLRAALIGHRSDLHGGSTRPCQTCRNSAKALGIKVPDRCAQHHVDKQALEVKGESDG